MIAKILKWRISNEIMKRKEVLVDLLAHLKCVPSVNEYGGLRRKDNGGSGGTRETGKPAKTLISSRKIFVLPFIFVR